MSQSPAVHDSQSTSALRPTVISPTATEVTTICAAHGESGWIPVLFVVGPQSRVQRVCENLEEIFSGRAFSTVKWSRANCRLIPAQVCLCRDVGHGVYGEELADICRTASRIYEFMGGHQQNTAAPISRTASSSTGPRDLLDKVASWLDQYHGRDGETLDATIPPAKFKDIARDLSVGEYAVSRAMTKLLQLSGEGQTPANEYRRLATTGRPKGARLACILAQFAGEVRPAHTGEVTASFYDVTQLTPDVIAEAREITP